MRKTFLKRCSAAAAFMHAVFPGSMHLLATLLISWQVCLSAAPSRSRCCMSNFVFYGLVMYYRGNICNSLLVRQRRQTAQLTSRSTCSYRNFQLLYFA